MLHRFRGMAPRALHDMYFTPERGFKHQRSTYACLRELCESGALRRLDLPRRRTLYILTRRALSFCGLTDDAHDDVARKTPSFQTASFLWLRSMVIGGLVARGYRVGRGPAELAALRRYLVDHAKAAVAAHKKPSVERTRAEEVLARLRSSKDLTLPVRSVCEVCLHQSDVFVVKSVCERCQQPMRVRAVEQLVSCTACGMLCEDASEHLCALHLGSASRRAFKDAELLSCDVAWKEEGGRYDVMIVIVENPRRGVKAQLEGLPLKVSGAAKVSIVLKTTDPQSRYDVKNGRFLRMGPRHKALLSAFSPGGYQDLFRYEKTAQLVDALPGLELVRAFDGGAV